MNVHGIECENGRILYWTKSYPKFSILGILQRDLALLNTGYHSIRPKVHWTYRFFFLWFDEKKIEWKFHEKHQTWYVKWGNAISIWTDVIKMYMHWDHNLCYKTLWQTQAHTHTKTMYTNRKCNIFIAETIDI